MHYHSPTSPWSALRGGLIVSCQAEGDSPFNTPAGVALFARAAVQGGAAGIRSEGIEKTRRILAEVSVPVIGLLKSSFADGTVCITGTLAGVRALAEMGCAVVAIDGTLREREGLSGPDFIRQVKAEMGCLVMADIATVAEGDACAAAGADCLSTTLSGYTPETAHLKAAGPDLALVRDLVARVGIPVFAEGRLNTPADAAAARQAGAWAVVAGSAITRPTLITEWYVQALQTGPPA
ncbi:putative N-acetylmannosamine-6-phosphate 2-epimerase [Hymenobacter aquaticus]|uniref:N-acylglucosamine-6-phosphate 2-epimerase n=1 Tax=Hymenobacter aquaticus TaxID=1867101 RepID=A0A4Z0Q9U0_9BACT|nr:putative N-acetylmannosamine-6-phosphate 2-epimerase [Hymenobacter aquaticus]TGE25821.1 putative N-acetylmannosamine-6-phosphate 2-epimerase [Hymenobacter aquaticus]